MWHNISWYTFLTDKEKKKGETDIPLIYDVSSTVEDHSAYYGNSRFVFQNKQRDWTERLGLEFSRGEAQVQVLSMHCGNSWRVERYWFYLFICFFQCFTTQKQTLPFLEGKSAKPNGLKGIYTLYIIQKKKELNYSRWPRWKTTMVKKRGNKKKKNPPFPPPPPPHHATLPPWWQPIGFGLFPHQWELQCTVGVRMCLCANEKKRKTKRRTSHLWECTSVRQWRMGFKHKYLDKLLTIFLPVKEH